MSVFFSPWKKSGFLEDPGEYEHVLFLSCPPLYFMRGWGERERGLVALLLVSFGGPSSFILYHIAVLTYVKSIDYLRIVCAITNLS